MLRRLIKITACRLPYFEQTSRSSQNVAQAVDDYLIGLLIQAAQDTGEENWQVATHIDETFRNRWWGLFTCYDVEDLPRTNNDLERYMRRIKTGHRRVSGHKNIRDFIIRYGRYAAYVDRRESIDDLLTRLRQVSQDDFLREQQTLDATLLRERKRHRFRHHQADYLRELEERWDAAVEKH